MATAFEALLAVHAARHGVPGAAIALLRDGDVTEAATGVADAATGERVTLGTRFAAGSLAKSMTATTIVLLAEDGVLALSDPLAEHVDELRGAAWAERATLADVLANRSRIPLRRAWEFEAEGEDDEAASRLAAEVAKGAAMPNRWSYSNVGWCLLGLVLARATGRSWEDALNERVLAPAGMLDTTFATRPQAEPRAVGHDVTSDGARPARPWHPRVYAAAGTTLATTALDLVRFARWHLEDPALASMREPTDEVAIHGWFDAWCSGWGRFDWDGATAWGWDGVVSGQRAVLRFLPERRCAVALMTNGSTGRAMFRSLANEGLANELGAAAPPLALEARGERGVDLEKYVGTFAWPDYRCTVTQRGDALVLESDGRTVEARPIDGRAFLVDREAPDNPAVTFGDFDDEGRPGVLYRMLWALPRVG